MPQETSPDYGFEPNFFSNHSVVLDHPYAEVFRTIGTSQGHERTTRLSWLCTGFELQHIDQIAIPKSTSLVATHVRILPPMTGDHVSEASVRSLPRQNFTLKETVRLLFGLIKKDVTIAGTLTWDEESRVALYESRTDSGILVWKSRVFEEIEGDKTRVTETVRGKCPPWLKSVVQSQASAGHRSALAADAPGARTC